MIRMTIEMRYSAGRQRETVAWFVPGETPREWLDEVIRWNAPLASLRLWIVPRSAEVRRPCGVLVTDEARGTVLTVPDSSRDHQIESLTQNGASIPYGCVAERLFVPVEATFMPHLDADDWHKLLPGGGDSEGRAICVWHPSAGLIA